MRERRVDLETRRQNAALDILEGDVRTRNFYRELIHLFVEQKLPFLIGGTFALQRYTGIVRRTKDIDFFIKHTDFELFARTCRAAGFRVELTYPHWLGKVFRATDFADLAFRSANGEGGVDDDWFKYAVQEQFWGMSVGLCPPEETIWSKSFVMERERFDGADVVHIIRACGETLDWDRLLRRFGDNWRVLLMHLISFGFVYPAERDIVPREVMMQLLQKAGAETESEVVSDDRICRGTLLSREQYLTDVYEWDYIDARLQPHGRMTEEDVDHWTAAIDR
jgi:hypothetical protein